MHKLTSDRRRWGAVALLSGVALGLAPFAAPYVWWRLPWASITIDRKPTAHASVYRSSQGQLLVWIAEPGTAGDYIVDPSAGEIHEPGYESLLDDVPEQNHLLVTPLFALVTDDRYRAGWGPHYDDDEATRGAVIQPGHLEFTDKYLLPGSSDYHSRRVRVAF